MVCIVVTRGMAAGEEASYLEPDFSARIVDVDAISLEGEKRAAVVDALATLAGAEGTDNLVRMKAMAIALRLDNMHAAARHTNDLLMAGGPIVPGGEGGGRLSEAVALLEETAAQLRDERLEGEDAVLYPYLVDIVAGARGKDASADGAASQGLLRWNLVLGGAAREGSAKETPVVAQPDGIGATVEGVSNGVMSGGVGAPENKEAPLVSEREEVTSPKNPGANAGAPESAEKVPGLMFQESKAALRTVMFEDLPEGGERAVACRISMEVSDEALTDEATPFYCPQGIGSGAAEQLTVAVRLLESRHAIGPLKNRIDIELVSLEDGRLLPLADSRIGVPALFLFDALLTGAKLDEEISVGGSLPSATERTAPRGRWGEIVAAAGRSGAAAVIASRPAEADLTDLMIAGDLDPLLRVQVIELSEAGEVESFLTANRDESAREAMRLFGEVQDLTARNDMRDLMANLKVQERLTQVVDLMPNHLSAKLLLEFGRGTLPQRMSLRGSLRLIDEVLEPVRELGQTGNATVVISSQDDLCADSLFGMRRLRTNLSEGSLAYCDAAVDFVELLREYLKLSNRSTNGAMQQAAGVEAARSRMEALRAGFKAALETP